MSSCAKNDYNIPFSIAYFHDVNQSETITSLKGKEMTALDSPNLGYENGIYWFKVVLPVEDANDKLVFDIAGNSINNLSFYNDSQKIDEILIDSTRPSYLIKNDTKNNTYYIKVNFEKQVHINLKIERFTASQLSEKYFFFMNGIYYGFVLMILLVNLFFYFSLKDIGFLYYFFFLIAITLGISDYDGLFNNYLPAYFLKYYSAITHFLIAVFGAIFANQFLSINKYIPKSNRVSFSLLALAFVFYLAYVFTGSFLFSAIGDSFSLLVLLHYWCIGLIISKTNKFARFFVAGYSLILFSAFLFIAPIDWGLQIFTVSLSTIKFAAFFEMLILTYAITYRVKVLQRENEIYRTQISKYIYEIQKLKSNSQDRFDIDKNLINKNLLEEKYELSTREIDVLLLVYKGFANNKIASDLNISLNTVKYHIRNIYEKLNINSKNEAIDMFSKIK
ncbi:7TM diverse intracellular signaling domain-containing protein [uncultured Polaribacter sp.]|uniref:7TM diverse intracellular signaling domain-containing protein n=1 Tax=uncultured Polaribacter sp. TaxID=174711 RepID=UPI00261C4BAC|nr:7TM diverse intracellular signaling domain-containing protein [uncultured Polaribacter sp.]